MKRSSFPILCHVALLPLSALVVAQESPAPLPPQVMKAIRLHAHGGVDVLQYEEAPRPQPEEDEILIRVIAAGVNPVDAKVRQGMFARMMGTKLPLIPGLDVSGVVEEAGASVTRFKPGDAVYAYLNFETQGGYAEFAIAKENEAAPKPKGLSYEGAAAMPVAAAT